MSLFTRFFLILMGFALIPVLATGIWILNSNEAVRENAKLLHQDLVSLAVEAVEIAVVEINRSLGFIEDLERNNKKDPTLDMKILQRAAATHPSFALLSLLDVNGMETIRIADPQIFPQIEYVNRSSETIVRQVREQGKASVGRVTQSHGTPLVSIAHPLADGRSVYAVYSLKTLWKRIKNRKVGKTGRIFLIDEAGHPLPGISDDFPEVHWPGPGPLPDEAGWLDNIRTAAGTMVGSYAYAPSFGFWTMSLQNREEAFARSETFPLQVAGFILSLSVLVGIGAFWLTSRMTAPLKQIIAGAQRAGRSEFTVPVPELGWGELSLLSQNFNQMMGTLRSYQELQVDRIMEEKAKVESLVRNIPEGILLADFDGHILYLNASARLILGMKGDFNALSQNIQLHEAIRTTALRDLLMRLTRRQKRTDAGEIEIAAEDGISRGLFSCGATVVSGKTRDIGILLVMRDVTAERNLEQMKEDFFHSLVHDLRSPISSIDGFVEIMQNRPSLGEKEKKYLDYIRTSSKLLRELVTNILDMAKLESGTMDIKAAAVDVQAIMDSVRDVYSIQAERKKVGLSFTVGPAPHTVVCDRGLIERVVMNLMGNALKFTPSGGLVKLNIGAAADAPQMEFSIADTGPGIPADQLKAVFEKFKQLEGGVQRGGYGLGLAICQKVVGLHKGEIWVESELGKGSKFIFRIPLQ